MQGRENAYLQDNDKIQEDAFHFDSLVGPIIDIRRYLVYHSKKRSVYDFVQRFCLHIAHIPNFLYSALYTVNVDTEKL